MKAYMREQRARGTKPAACARNPRPISAQPVGVLIDEGCFRRSSFIEVLDN